MYSCFVSREPYRVVVIVDRVFGERLARIAHGIPVWIMESAANTAAVKKWRQENPQPSHTTGITVFTSPRSQSAERSLLDQIDAVDLHHGIHSADPPYSELEVFGVHMTEAIRSKLELVGFTDVRNTEVGFVAARPSRMF